MPFVYEGWSLEKIIMEARYPNTPAIFDKRTDLLKIYMGEFPQYDISKPDTTVMQSEDMPPRSLTFQANRIGLSWDEPESLDEFLNMSSEIINTAVNMLLIKKIKRIGIRASWILPMQKDDAVKVIMSRLMIEDYKDLGSEIVPELAVKFNTFNRGVNMAAQVTNVKRVAMGLNEQNVRSIEGLLLDVDVYTTDLNNKADGSIFAAKDIFYKAITRFKR